MCVTNPSRRRVTSRLTWCSTAVRSPFPAMCVTNPSHRRVPSRLTWCYTGQLVPPHPTRTCPQMSLMMSASDGRLWMGARPRGSRPSSEIRAAAIALK
jgi:hypothetical protein